MQQKSLILILARELADKLASAVFVVNSEGRLVYYNEKAGEVLGKPFGEVGTIGLEEWSGAFAPMDPGGQPLEPDEIPVIMALKGPQPVHRSLRIRTLDGESRDVAVTAVPLFVHPSEIAGALAVFWEDVPAGPAPEALEP